MNYLKTGIYFNQQLLVCIFSIKKIFKENFSFKVNLSNVV